MSPFVDWLSVAFKKLSSSSVSLLAANNNSLLVRSIIVANTTNNPMRFSLLKLRSPGQGDISTTTLINELLLEPKQSIDVLSNREIGDLTLLKSITPNFTDSISCYSYAPSQIFDVNIEYLAFKELPFNS